MSRKPESPHAIADALERAARDWENVKGADVTVVRVPALIAAALRAEARRIRAIENRRAINTREGRTTT